VNEKTIIIGGVVIGIVGLIVFFTLRSDLKSAGAAAVDVAGTVAHAVNPLNPENVAASSVNAVGQTLSGDKGWTLGAWIYDVTHP